jgi:outer membrane lipopolysaccharide assembly protein LptE/RlpB
MELCYTQGMRRFLFLTICATLLLAQGCGYQFQGRQNPLNKLGIEKIYVQQFRNRTYRPGVEQLFSTAMVREIQKSRSFRLVESEKEADAVLSGEVSSAEANPSSTRSESIGGKSLDVATEFNSSVTCNVTLTDSSGRAIFSQGISGSKIYPGSARTGDAGSTNALVNESEQRLAIQFLASQMMASVYQRMIDTF